MCACAGEVPSWALATVKAEHVSALLDTAAVAAGPLPSAATGAKTGATGGDEAAGALPGTSAETRGAAKPNAANGDEALGRAAHDAPGAPSPRDADPAGFEVAAVAPGHAAETPEAPHAQQASVELSERGGSGAQMGDALGAALEPSQGVSAGAGAMTEPPVPGEPVTLAGAGFGGFVQPDSSALRGLDEAMRSAGAEGRLNDDAMDLG